MSSTNFTDAKDRIREERKRLGLRQEDAAKKCGLSRSMWVRYENGQSVLDGAALRAFGELGADTNYIINGIKNSLGEIEVKPNRLYEERRRLNYSVQEISDLVDVSELQWENYEKNGGSIDQSIINKLIAEGIDIKYLVGERDFADPTILSGKSYFQLEGTELKLYSMAHAAEWVDEAEEQNAPFKLHPALKEMLRSAVSLHGLSRAGLFRLIDTLHLVEIEKSKE